MGPRRLVRRWIVVARRRSLIASAGLVLLAVGSYLLLLVSLDPGESREAVINVAGRQRMLSQRIAGLSLAWAAGAEGVDEPLARSVAEFEAANAALQEGDVALGLTGEMSPSTRSVYERPGGVDDAVRRLAHATTGLLGGTGDPSDATAVAQDAWGPVLTVLEEAVDAHEAEALATLRRVRRVAAAVLLASIALVTVIGVFVFRPLIGGLDHLADRLGGMWQHERDRRRRQREAAAIVTHELRTPLTAAFGFARTLESGWDRLADEQRRLTVSRLAASTGRLAALVEDLTFFAGTDTPLDSGEAYPLDDLLEAAVEEADGPEPSLDGVAGRRATLDPVRVRLLLSETISNATIHGGGVVAVAARVEDGALVIEVDDDGPGLDADEKDAMLAPFARKVDVDNHGLAAGAAAPGMGLAIVQTIVSEFGGSLALTLRDPGLRVEVRLPVVADPHGVLRASVDRVEGREPASGPWASDRVT